MSGMRIRNTRKPKPIKPEFCGNDWERIANRVASMPTIVTPRRMRICDLERASAVVSSSENLAQATFKMGMTFGVSGSMIDSSIINAGVSGDFVIMCLTDLAGNEPGGHNPFSTSRIFDLEPLVVPADLGFSVRLSDREFCSQRQAFDQRGIADDWLLAECNSFCSGSNLQHSTV